MNRRKLYNLALFYAQYVGFPQKSQSYLIINVLNAAIRVLLGGSEQTPGSAGSDVTPRALRSLQATLASKTSK